ncbi:MAG: tRNA (adenosine(37)-N6)-threonylcarbamoyltransferase complex transferase subunit TsaD [Acidobacteria bacterium]|nr:tRNA (adenosine(37)-N6)-threonylcarbamoyltransferase complex transferase subunit TsaD [Acidobacteriota bacterium]
MNILGLESSCDETAAAVVSDGRQVLSSVVASQVETHERYGGVVPELASREHLRVIVPVVEEAIGRANVPIDAVAVTQGPGLVGSLLVGITFAKAFALVRGLPLVPVNHLEGHIHAVLLEHPQTELPALALIVSGGHTHYYRCESNFRYELLSRTRDDAAGEAYDKVAKLLGYAYPGGPILDQLAPHGNPKAVKFTRAKMSGNALDLSFSGIKTAVLRWTEARDLRDEIAARRALVRPTLEQWRAATPQATLDLIASFQATVIDELLSRVRVFAEDLDLTNVIISGGVACNAGLRAAARRLPYAISFPTPKLSTDNAAMIAAAAYPRLLAGHTAGHDLRPKANFALA